MGKTETWNEEDGTHESSSGRNLPPSGVQISRSFRTRNGFSMDMEQENQASDDDGRLGNDGGVRLGRRLGGMPAKHVARHVAAKVALAALPLVIALVIGVVIMGVLGLGSGGTNLVLNGTSKYPSTNVISSSCVMAGNADGSGNGGTGSGITCKQAGAANPGNGSGSGNGQEYSAASDTQKAVADKCRTTESTGAGYCAAWVSNVYENAGLSGPSGNANDMYYAYCTSSDRNDLKVGMIIAVPSVYNGTVAGKEYGHVGIYIGDGLVMHSTEGSVHTDTLDDWISTFDGPNNTVKWGFGPGLS